MSAHENLLNLMQRSRGAGSTQAMIDGIKNHKGHVVVLIHSQEYARELRERISRNGAHAEVLSVAEGDSHRFSGRPSRPIMADTSALYQLASEWNDLDSNYRRTLRQLDECNRELREANHRAAQYLDNWRAVKEQLRLAEERLAVYESCPDNAPSLGDQA